MRLVYEPDGAVRQHASYGEWQGVKAPLRKPRARRRAAHECSTSWGFGAAGSSQIETATARAAASRLWTDGGRPGSQASNEPSSETVETTQRRTVTIASASLTPVMAAWGDAVEPWHHGGRAVTRVASGPRAHA